LPKVEIRRAKASTTHVVPRTRSELDRLGRRASWFDALTPTVNDGIESALEQARDAAGGGDVRIGGGADVIVRYLNAGLVNEFSVAVSPVLLGIGLRLFDGIDHGKVSLSLLKSIGSPMVTHVTYAVGTK
jgi:dihydrofolate reductase